MYVSLPDLLRYPKRRKGAPEELPEPSVPSDERGLPSVTEVVPLNDSGVAVFSKEGLHVENQDLKPETATLAITSDVIEGSVVSKEESKSEEQQSQKELSIISTKDSETEHGLKEKGSFVSDHIFASSPSDTSKETIADMSLQVNVGDKEVFVDLLEAMEVVAPDLEKKTLLLRKIEELTEKLQNDSGKQSILLQKIRKLKHKLKSFCEEAILRREQSRRRMEEFVNRDHYRHMNIDEKTLTQLEMLFEAMRYVLQADKDMRTGKTLLEESSETHSKAEKGNVSKESSRPGHLSDLISVLKLVQKDNPNQKEPDEDSKPPDTSDSETNKKSKKKGVSQESRSRKDPPPPDSAGETWPEGEPSEDADNADDKSGTFANELGNIANTVNNVNSQTGDSKSWFAGLSVPYISAWWEGGSKQGQESHSTMQHNDNTGRVKENPNSSSDAQNNALLAQIFYIVSLGWIFNSERDETESKSEEKIVKSGESSCEDKAGGEENECRSETPWYWYPLSGTYRVYAWVFSSSRESA